MTKSIESPVARVTAILRAATLPIVGPVALAPAVLVPAALALPAVALPLAPAAAQTSTASADLALVQRHIRAITTMTADFAQTDRRGQVQTGKLLWKQPGHIRFQYQGDSLLIVADGRSLYMIDYDVKQVQRWPIRHSPLGALLDPGRDLTRYGRLVDTGNREVLSIDVRDPAHPEYGVINLVFQRDAGGPAGLRLHGWVAKDAQGNRTSIKLTNGVYGAAIADSAFRWRDPRPSMRGGAR